MQDALKIPTAFDQRKWYRYTRTFGELGANQQTDATRKVYWMTTRQKKTSTQVSSLLNTFFREEIVRRVWLAELMSCVERWVSEDQLNHTYNLFFQNILDLQETSNLTLKHFAWECIALSIPEFSLPCSLVEFVRLEEDDVYQCSCLPSGFVVSTSWRRCFFLAEPSLTKGGCGVLLGRFGAIVSGTIGSYREDWLPFAWQIWNHDYNRSRTP